MKPTVTVGIPAYNEEQNIAELLSSVLQQEQTNFVLEKIIVLSDGSSDGTVTKAKSVSSDLILVIDSLERKGKRIRMNELLESNTSDILVMLDADCLPASNRVICEFVGSFECNAGAGLVFGEHVPIAPQTFGERVAYFGYDLWNRVLELSNNVVYKCVGSNIALSNDFAGRFKIPEGTISNDDTYTYYFAITTGYSPVFNKNARVIFKLPDTVYDYIVQLRRTVQNAISTEKYFDISIVQKIGYIPLTHKIKALASMLKDYPITIFAVYILSDSL